jgi:precorrin-2 dehydrogenase/sirohydrochlorin ferrochelatase
MFFPVYLNLKGKRVVVIGGGEVAERKVMSLMGTGATVVVISPEVTSQIGSSAEAKRIEVIRRKYMAGDCENAVLILSATDDPETGKAVREEANRLGVMPAVVRRADLAVAISTGGISPALSARLRQKISAMLGPEYERLLNLLAAARPEIRRRIESEGDRRALHYRILDSDVLSLLGKNDIEGAERRLKQIIETFEYLEKTP